jgi:hypothetical protein
MKDDFSFVDQTRRDLHAKIGTGLVAITVNSAVGQVSPERARARVHCAGVMSSVAVPVENIPGS